MLIGSFSLATDSASVTDRIRKATDCRPCTFHPAATEGFTGGYYLHPRLPWSHDDFYYADELNDIIVMMSGCAYNKSELYKILDITVPVPDPVVIAGLFMKEGPGFVRVLNGDFAIVIGRPSKREAYLFRDHVGIRPFVYANDNQSISFSTDISGLCRAYSEGQDIRSEFLTGYFKYIDYMITPSDKVKKLPPGHFLHFSDNGVEVTQYWEPEKIRPERKMTSDQMLSDLAFILQDAVRIRCDSRFISGSHVTGGLDSGIVAVLARKEYNQQADFYGFSWSPRDFTSEDVCSDERELVTRLCEKSGIVPVFSDMTENGFPQIVSNYYENQGYFSEDSSADQAAGLSTNLIFSGWGGDEFISTGARAIDADLLLGLRLHAFLRRNKISHPRRLMNNVLHSVLLPASGILDKKTLKSFSDDARYLKEPFKQSDRKAIKNFYFHTSRHQFHIGMLHFYHLQERCESWTVSGYRRGIEYRYPLLDKRIIEYMLRVPSDILCQTDLFRPVLRKLAEGILPEEVRLNKSKNDPVYWSFMDHLYECAAVDFMKEVDDWRGNSELHFIDFELLTEDISKFRSGSPDLEEKVLFRALVFIKAINDFTLRYHHPVC